MQSKHQINQTAITNANHIDWLSSLLRIATNVVIWFPFLRTLTQEVQLQYLTIPKRRNTRMSLGWCIFFLFCINKFAWLDVDGSTEARRYATHLYPMNSSPFTAVEGPPNATQPNSHGTLSSSTLNGRMEWMNTTWCGDFLTLHAFYDYDPAASLALAAVFAPRTSATVGDHSRRASRSEKLIIMFYNLRPSGEEGARVVLTVDVVMQRSITTKYRRCWRPWSHLTVSCWGIWCGNCSDLWSPWLPAGVKIDCFIGLELLSGLCAKEDVTF